MNELGICFILERGLGCLFGVCGREAGWLMVVELVVWSAALCWVWFRGVLDGLDKCITIRCSVDGKKAFACHGGMVGQV